jgi:hypothetical protein
VGSLSWYFSGNKIHLASWRDTEDEMNIFDRAKELARGDRSVDIIIRTLKAERFEHVESYLPPTFRRELRKIRQDAKASKP